VCEAFAKDTKLEAIDMEYCVAVKFQKNGMWSKPYAYKSKIPYKLGDVVVVPTDGFYGVGEVLDCVENYAFRAKVDYKWVCGLLHDLSYGADDKFEERFKIFVKNEKGEALTFKANTFTVDGSRELEVIVS
jgi:hypothetical protein